MAIPVYLVKRKLRKKKRNGQQIERYSLRWQDPTSGKFMSETCATSDKVQAEDLQKAKWAEVNGLGPPKPEPEAKPKATWDDCKQALQRAMEADHCRPTYVEDALITFNGVRTMFPDAASPADVTADMANEYKRRRSEAKLSPWTIKGDLSCLKSVFGKWLGKECGLLDPAANPFANVKAPRCDDPDVRIVTAEETAALYAWLNERWHNWRLPLVYLEVAGLVGWRATELASMRVDDLLPDGFIRVLAGTSKTRKIKHGWLPAGLHDELRAQAADGWAFGRFADELRRRLLMLRKQPNHAARVRGFTPERLVGWIQDELQRFNEEKATEAAEAGRTWEAFTLHDFRRTAITALQMSGVTEKEASVMVGATPEVIRRHYEKLDQQAIARRSVERRLAQTPQSLRVLCARPLDDGTDMTQTASA